MPKCPTLPPLYNNALQFSITELKKWGYLVPDRIETGVITWSRNGNKRGSISITSNTLVGKHYIELNYDYNNEPRKYEVQLVSIPANIGNGVIWYFECPKTHKRCRKLYSIDGYFFHREAFSGCMYESQTYSKKWRQMERVYGPYFDQDKLYGQIHKKHFKKTYAGTPTKRYLKITSELEKAERISIEEVERLMVCGM